MIGLALLYFAGKAFYDLAATHGKSKWGFAILGVVSYYAGLFIGAMLIGVIIAVVSSGNIEDYSDIAISLMSLPVGVLTCWGFYKILERQWKLGAKRVVAEDILDAELPPEENQQ